MLLARAEQANFSEREKLIRLMGLWGQQINFTLAERLPDLPKTVTEMTDVEAQALRSRLDVRSAVSESTYVADQMGFRSVMGYFDGSRFALHELLNVGCVAISRQRSAARNCHDERQRTHPFDSSKSHIDT